MVCVSEPAAGARVLPVTPPLGCLGYAALYDAGARFFFLMLQEDGRSFFSASLIRLPIPLPPLLLLSGTLVSMGSLSLLLLLLLLLLPVWLVAVRPGSLLSRLPAWAAPATAATGEAVWLASAEGAGWLMADVVLQAGDQRKRMVGVQIWTLSGPPLCAVTCAGLPVSLQSGSAAVLVVLVHVGLEGASCGLGGLETDTVDGSSISCLQAIRTHVVWQSVVVSGLRSAFTPVMIPKG